MKNMKAWLSMCALGLTMAAGAKEYVLPPNAPVATLTIENETSAPIEPATFSKAENCSGRLWFAKGNAWNRPMIMPGSSLRVSIDASTEFNLYINSKEGTSVSINSYSNCSIVLAFKPEEGGIYRAISRTDRAECLLVILREVVQEDGSRKVIKEPTTRRRAEPGIAMVGFGPQCGRDDVAATPATPAEAP